MASSIAKATVEDVPILAGIICASYGKEVISQFAYRNWPDEANQTAFHAARLRDRIQRPGTNTFKYLDASTGHIVGFVCFSREGSVQAPGNSIQEEVRVQPRDQTPSAKLLQQIPPFFNAEFVRKSAAEVEQLMKLMRDDKYYYLSAFAVRPEQQRQGIGSQLMKHCLNIADNAGSRTWLIAFPGSHSMYLKFGFKDVDHVDIDLNSWDGGRMRGFGIYRQYAMVREPGGN